ncbi:hypothetical protein C9928_05715 [Pseudidiomarina aestuarii]|uniref:DUF4386 domain-containing protein n=1 Tax=Pseudidiomarina aestuarii TaxID=624146 RepID=A0A2T4D4H1_9GAMM|nr:hypothetical protein C9986_01210 [Pseudidiomarina aestuarii]PTB85390.1 hypothetical protein C9988_01325 [Pseudidiomarina aestuarii]PTB88714.1 hypothetical protein C9928_05715 [Pseudidiomarina aestuarii]
MKSNFYQWAGMAALALAILFPIYWLGVFGLAIDNYENGFLENITTLDAWDVLFVIIGALEVFVYLALRQSFKDQIEGGLAAVALLVMAALVALFHLTVVVDISLSMGLLASYRDGLIEFVLIASLVVLFLYAAVAFVFAIALLLRFADLSMLMKVFACGVLIMAVFQFTVILGIANIFLFPVLMLLLAVHFWRGEQTVEVV